MSRDLYESVELWPTISPYEIGAYADRLLKENPEIRNLLRNYLVCQVENVLCANNVAIEGVTGDGDEEYKISEAIYDCINNDDLKNFIKDLPLNPFLFTDTNDPRNKAIIKSNVEEAAKNLKNIEHV